MTRALYPGTFDPVTLGHLDLIERALRVFDSLVIAVSENPTKRPLFPHAERIALLREATRDLPNLEIVGFSGLLVDLIREQQADLLIKGLRAVSDFEYELQMALTNRKLDPRVEIRRYHVVQGLACIPFRLKMRGARQILRVNDLEAWNGSTRAPEFRGEDTQ